MEIPSEYVGESKQLTIDDAKKLKRVTGEAAKEFEDKVLAKQDGQFKDLYVIVFGWKEQGEGKPKKLMSKLPSGKLVFPDKTENVSLIEQGLPYICLVYDRKVDEEGKPGREAFAKIICEEYTPKIYVPSSRLPHMVWRDKSGTLRNKAPFGNTFEERIISAIKEMEKMGFPSVKVVFRVNERDSK
jgi:hypothetical protein